MLAIKRLSKEFYQRNEAVTVVNNISLEVKKGSVIGFLGPNGAGKTTTVKMVVGLLFPTKGSITIEGFPAGSLEAKQRVGFMPENPQFYSHLRAREVLEFVGNLFGLEEKLIKKRTNELLKLVSLEKFAEELVKKFSKGMIQRLAFATALVNSPQFLVLDEPLDGLDPLGRLDLKRLLLKLKKEGKTVFFSSHILADVEELCDQVIIIHRGKIIAQGAPNKLTKKNQTLEEMFVTTIRDHD